jgi:hypothetical protein
MSPPCLRMLPGTSGYTCTTVYPCSSPGPAVPGDGTVVLGNQSWSVSPHLHPSEARLEVSLHPCRGVGASQTT